MEIEEYIKLVPSQHRQKPKYTGTLEALIRPLCDVEKLLQELRTTFDLDTAIGKQLDAVGIRIGRTRYLHAPLEGVYFSWNTNLVGWNEGVWKSKYNPEVGIVSLPDDIYRILLRAKIAANKWDGTIPGAYEAWEIAFSTVGSILLIQDNQNMSMVVGIANIPLTPIFEQLLVQGYIPLKPEGVRIKWYAVTPDGGALFAWNCDSPALAGWVGKNKTGGRWPKYLVPIYKGD